MPATNGANGTTHSWTSLPQASETSVVGLNKALNADSWWQAFVDTKAITEPVTFGVQSAGSSDAVLVSVSPGTKKREMFRQALHQSRTSHWQIGQSGGRSSSPRPCDQPSQVADLYLQ